MTVDTMSMAVSLLISQGIHATVEYPGTIHVITGQSELFVFGTANPMFGADIYKTYRDEMSDVDDSIETSISSDCNDPVLVAETVAKTIYPEFVHTFGCALCRCALTPGDNVVFHQNSDTSIDVFCSDACRNETQEEPESQLSGVARQIFDAVMKAMQDAEEIWGPGDDAYIPLMEAISAEANQRIANFRKLRTQGGRE